MKKIKIQIKNRFTGSLIFEWESDNNTIANTVKEAIKANADLRDADLRDAGLRGANLRDADLRGANLRYADLSYANLRDADLRYANLRDADLRYAGLRGANLRDADLRDADLRDADLRDADLRDAVTDKRYISISCIGSQKRMTTYCFDDDIIWCGCFKGTLCEFEAKVKETHAHNSQFLKEYMGFINYLKSLK